MESTVSSENNTDNANDKVLNLDTFAKDGFKALTNGIRNSNALPIDSDWNFYKLNESFCKVINSEGDRLLRLINSVLRKYDIEDNINIRKSVEDKLELIVEANDTILESVSDNIDELNGIKKKNVEPVEFQTVTAELPISGSWNRINRATFSVSSSINSPRQNVSSSQSIHLLTGKNVIRPQKCFKDKIDNSNNYPWQPRITEKPNSIRPLALFLEESIHGDVFCHPYQTELDQFEPPPDQLRSCKPKLPKPITDTPLHVIQTVDKLNDLVEELRKHPVIGVDLEHHSYRTFMGITCLMQISTTEADYIIDTLELRSNLYVLNEIFTRPSIIKVFHGADSDIPWLQRDLSLYVVNMFDTHQAAKQLGYSGLSLAYLLQRFCKFLPNKQFQLADWRIRPLPQELINYAREDTHYLIYIYGILKNELLKQGNGQENILKSVIQRSTEICKKRYCKPILSNDSHLDFYRKCKRLFDNKQMYALKELYQWRDKMAREEDESTGYVLPNHMLLQISEMLPREMQGILACCNPIPPLIRANLLELHQIILKAREQSLEKPIMKEDNRSVGSTQQFSKINIDSPIHCPHDLTKQSEFRDDLSVLLSKNTMSIADWKVKLTSRFDGTLEKKSSKCSVFNTPEHSNEDESNCPVNSLKFLGPYERYKLVKPYVQAEEEKDLAENTEEKNNDKSTDDRIASLHEHFLKVAKDCPKSQIESQPNEILLSQSTAVISNENYHSLTEMNGPRKRKFEENCEILKYNSHGAKKRKRNNITLASDPASHETKNNPLHTPIPDLNNTDNTKRKRRKRKAKTAQQAEQQPEQQKPQQPQQKQQHQLQHRQQPQSRGQHPMSHNIDNNKRPQRRGRGGLIKKKFGNKKPQKLNSNNDNKSPAIHHQSNESNNFAPFDYSSVDYGQFRGGASGSSNRASSSRGFHSKFRGKNKRKFRGNTNNKFSTFDNSKKRKT